MNEVQGLCTKYTSLSNYTELQVQKVTRSQYCTCVDVKYAYKIYQYKNNRKKQSIQE